MITIIKTNNINSSYLLIPEPCKSIFGKLDKYIKIYYDKFVFSMRKKLYMIQFKPLYYYESFNFL